jgi:hypothetical protein
MSSLVNTAYTDATNPDERGCKFVSPVNGTLVGVGGNLRFGASGTTQLGVYYPDGTKLSNDNEMLMEGDKVNIASSADSYYIPFSPVKLTRGKTYVISAKATATASNNTILPYAVANDSYIASAMMGGLRVVTRNGGSGSFSDVTNAVPSFFPVIRRIDPICSARRGR